VNEDVQQLVWLATGNNKGCIRAAARLMTLVENSPDGIAELLAGSAPWPEPRMVVGLTGPPGSGKSVLVDRLIAGLRKRHPERRIGVIGVDPSSPFTGGALLGDRVRMMRHAADPMVFIRSSATRGRLGGLMLGAAGMIRVMGLIGCDVVLIETVGVGQGEVDVTKVADLVTLVFAPGQGDSIQLLKAGLIEIGDIFVINKADQTGAGQLYSQLRAALNLRCCTGGGRPAEVCLISALEDRGVSELIERFESHYERDHAQWQARRKAALEDEIRQAILEELGCQCAEAIGSEEVQRVLRGEVSVASLVKELLRKLAHSERCKMIRERSS
jgi:LAO/AO transport system kinase